MAKDNEAKRGRPRSTVKVPDKVADWNKSLWRRIWRSAFMVLQDETLARRIANGALKPDAIKDKFVAVPDSVASSKKNTWAKVFQKSLDVTDDRRKARRIAFAVTGREDKTKSFLSESSQKVTNMLAKDRRESGNGEAGKFLVHRRGGDVQVVERPSQKVKAMIDNVPLDKQGWIEGYLVSWGNTRDTDLQGEFFTQRTEFCLDWFEERPVLYHHGMDNTTGLKKVGTFKTIKIDDIGMWVQAQLDLRDKYAQAVYDMVKAKQFGWSSGSVDHLVKIADNGEILVWPLIEGSVTPTPAQPAKTAVRPIKGAMGVINSQINEPQYISMQAFKAVLSDDRNSSSSIYLRGLDAKLTGSGRVVREGIPNNSRNRSLKSIGVQSMTQHNDSAWYITRAVAKALGIKDASPDELEAVANEVSPVVEEEVAVAAAEALDQESMAMDTESMASYRSRRRPVRGYGYRNSDPYAMDEPVMSGYMADESVMNDPYAMDDAQMGGYMGTDPDAVLMDEVSTSIQMEEAEKMAARQFQLRAMRRAMRDIAEGPDGQVEIMEYATENARPLAGETLPGGKYYGRRSRRSYRNDDALLSDEISALSDEGYASNDDQIMADVAVASYRRGFRSGMDSAVRQIEGNLDARSAEEQAVASEEAIVSSKTSDSDVVDDAVRAYRAGYRRGLKRAIRQIEEDTKMEDMVGKSYGYRNAPQAGFGPSPVIAEAPPTDYPTVPDGYEPVPEASGVLGNTKSRRGRRRPVRGYAYRNQDPMMTDPYAMDEPIMGGYMTDPYAMDEPIMGGYMSDPYAMDEPVMMGDYATASDPFASDPYAMDEAQMSDPMMSDPFATDGSVMNAYMMDQAMQIDPYAMDEGIPMSKNYRRRPTRAYRSAGVGDAQQQAAYWRSRALQLERAEAPGQRAFKSISGIRDVADREGNYEYAFKSYLQKGLGLMTDSEKYILTGKGKTRWENTTFAFDNATKSVKTYNSSSDSSGGFLVPEDWVNELNKNIMTQTTMAAECRTRTTTSDRIVQPSINTSDGRRAHAAQVKWPGESPAANTEHRTAEDTYEQVVIPIHVMLISLAATNSSLEDSTFNLEEEINEAFAEAVAVSYDQLIWGGDGQGKMQGIVQNERVTANQSLGVQSVGGHILTGNDNGIVSADSLKQMLYHLPQGYRGRAKWYMNSNTGLQIATLKDGEGNYLIDNRDEGLRSVGIPDRLLGKPIVYNEWASDIATNGYPIVLADLNRGYVIGRRVEFSIKRFDDSNYAEHDQVLFLGRARLGGQVLQPAAFKVLKVAAS